MPEDRTDFSKIIAKIADYERLYRVEQPSKNRPHPIRVEDAFDQFVSEFGALKISDVIKTKDKMPLNADYHFPAYNAIMELKTLEGIFSGFEGIKQLRQLYIDCGHSAEEALQAMLGLSEMPELVQHRATKRIRRSIEQRIVKARKQLRTSKAQIGNPETASVLLIAVDQPPIFGQQNVLVILAKLMADNYSDEHIDCVVYINPNVPTKLSPDGMEFGGWFPFYRDDEVNDRLSEFINLVGNRWLNFMGRRSGSPNPILEFDEPEGALAVLRGQSIVTPDLLEKRG